MYARTKRFAYTIAILVLSTVALYFGAPFLIPIVLDLFTVIFSHDTLILFSCHPFPEENILAILFDVVVARLGVRWWISRRETLFDLLIDFAFAISMLLFSGGRASALFFGSVYFLAVVHMVLVKSIVL